MAEKSREKETNEQTKKQWESIDRLHTTMVITLETAHVERVFGKPIQVGENLIIPAAEVIAGYGYGFGGGFGEEAKETPSRGGGAGGGGGGRTFSRPVAVVIASPAGVRVEPVIDRTKIALAALTAAGFMAGMVMRMMRPVKNKS